MRSSEKVYLVIASINPLDNLPEIFTRDNKTPSKIVIVDEGDESVRKYNSEILRRLGLLHEFYGPREREKWFRERFGSSYERYLSLIPERSHAETSFGFLVSFEEDADYIIELDDDVFQDQEYRLVSDHLDNLNETPGVLISSSSKWINTIDFLDVNIDRAERIFPRGHPYDPSVRSYVYTIRESVRDSCILNMGLWTGHPDLDAVTILIYGGLDGRSIIRSAKILQSKVIAERGSYFAVCSMNTSFRRDLVPAFYQLYMRYMGVDRFDDIWSGIFAKKIADALGDRFCLGKPALRHDKRPRSVWKDLRAELEGMIMNEILWRIVDEAEIYSRKYVDAYRELAQHLEKNINRFRDENHIKFIKIQVEKMYTWTEAIDKI
ncbi:MAG: hypothetical protein ABWJ42_01985 [Sulfolobales archaeon]